MYAMVTYVINYIKLIYYFCQEYFSFNAVIYLKLI